MLNSIRLSGFSRAQIFPAILSALDGSLTGNIVSWLERKNAKEPAKWGGEATGDCGILLLRHEA
jgi:hypothetical protein